MWKSMRPFQCRELLAEIQVILRRVGTSSEFCSSYPEVSDRNGLLTMVKLIHPHISSLWKSSSKSLISLFSSKASTDHRSCLDELQSDVYEIISKCLHFAFRDRTTKDSILEGIAELSFGPSTLTALSLDSLKTSFRNPLLSKVAGKLISTLFTDVHLPSSVVPKISLPRKIHQYSKVFFQDLFEVVIPHILIAPPKPDLDSAKLFVVGSSYDTTFFTSFCGAFSLLKLVNFEDNLVDNTLQTRIASFFLYTFGDLYNRDMLEHIFSCILQSQFSILEFLGTHLNEAINQTSPESPITLIPESILEVSLLWLSQLNNNLPIPEKHDNLNFASAAYESVNRLLSSKKQNRTISSIRSVRFCFCQYANIASSGVIDESTFVPNLETLRRVFIGQSQVLRAIRWHLEMRVRKLDTSSSALSFLFMGPSGTGKTELSRLIASLVHQQPLSELLSSKKYLQYNMAQMREKEDIQNWVGARKGLVGDGELTQSLLQNPDAVVLLDEIEKAHPHISEFLLSVFDHRGTIQESKTGIHVPTESAVFIMTSNIGRDALLAEWKRQTERSCYQKKDKLFVILYRKIANAELSLPYIRGALGERRLNPFAIPEIRHRIREVVLFLPYEEEDIARIINLHIYRSIHKILHVVERKWLSEDLSSVEGASSPGRLHFRSLLPCWSDDVSKIFVKMYLTSPTHGFRPIKQEVDRVLSEVVYRSFLLPESSSGYSFQALKCMRNASSLCVVELALVDGQKLRAYFIEHDLSILNVTESTCLNKFQPYSADGAEPQDLSAASWMHAEVGENHRIPNDFLLQRFDFVRSSQDVSVPLSSSSVNRNRFEDLDVSLERSVSFSESLESEISVDAETTLSYSSIFLVIELVSLLILLSLFSFGVVGILELFSFGTLLVATIVYQSFELLLVILKKGWDIILERPFTSSLILLLLFCILLCWFQWRKTPMEQVNSCSCMTGARLCWRSCIICIPLPSGLNEYWYLICVVIGLFFSLFSLMWMMNSISSDPSQHSMNTYKHVEEHSGVVMEIFLASLSLILLVCSLLLSCMSILLHEGKVRSLFDQLERSRLSSFKVSPGLHVQINETQLIDTVQECRALLMQCKTLLEDVRSVCSVLGIINHPSLHPSSSTSQSTSLSPNISPSEERQNLVKSDDPVSFLRIRGIDEESILDVSDTEEVDKS